MDTVSTTPTTKIPDIFTKSTTPVNNSGIEQKTQFLKLLVAQLKGQNPLDPLDGTQFVSQLAQFSSVEELINIRTLLEGISKNSESSPKGTAPPNTFEGA